MANQQTNTVENTATEASSPAAALWRIAVADFERECAAYHQALAVMRAELAEAEELTDKAEKWAIIHAAENKHDEAVDRVGATREKMWATPAPDASAITYKLAVFHSYLALGDEQDTDRVLAFLNDATRLFGAVEAPKAE